MSTTPAIHTGERAPKTGELRCERCHKPVYVLAGYRVPTCPHCGYEAYDEQEDEDE